MKIICFLFAILFTFFVGSSPVLALELISNVQHTGPVTITDPALSLSDTAEMLRGRVDSNGSVTEVSFQYGTSPTLAGASVLEKGTLAGNLQGQYRGRIKGLVAGTIYYYRIVGKNADNAAPQLGEISSFTTSPDILPPVLTVVGGLGGTLSIPDDVTLVSGGGGIILNGGLVGIAQSSGTIIVGPGGITTAQAGSVYVDQGAIARDLGDGDLTANIVATSTVNTRVAGDYTVTYRVHDLAGNTAEAVRKVTVLPDREAPVITLKGSSAVTLIFGSSYVDAGATAVDAVDGDLTRSIVTTGTVNTLRPGDYTVTYRVQDLAGNTAEAVRKVTVLPDLVGPAINIAGENPQTVFVGAVYADAGATAVDIIDGSVAVVAENTVDTKYAGNYRVSYTARDRAGNVSLASRAVKVVQNVKTVLFTAEKGVRFGVPSINDAGHVAFLATDTRPDGDGQQVLSDDTTPVAVGDGVAGVVGASKVEQPYIAALGEPALNNDGTLAFFATLGAARAGESRVLMMKTGANPPRVVAQQGARMGTLASFALTDDGLFFRGTLAGASAANDSVLVVRDFNEKGAQNHTVLREGEVIGTQRLGSFTALVATPGAGGQSREQGSGVLVRETFTDGTQALVEAAADGNATLQRTGFAAGRMKGVTLSRFGLPVYNHRRELAFLAGLKGEGITARNDVAIFASNGRFGNEGNVQMLRKGYPVPGLNGLRYAGFKDPVANTNGAAGTESIATLATLVGADVRDANREALVWKPYDAPAAIVARLGDHAAGTTSGVVWRAFKDIALPDRLGPAFVATLSGPGVTPQNNVGLWALDSNRALQLLIRTGDAVGEQTVKSFTALSAVSGSGDQTRGFNANKQFVYRVTFSDDTQAVVRVDVP